MSAVLAHVADIHFGAEDRDALTAFGEALKGMPEAVVVVAGDLTLKGKRSEFKAAAAWLSTLDRPIMLCAGNHDVPYYGLLQRLLKPFDAYEESFPDHDEQKMLRDDFALLSLNTARGVQFRLNWAHGAISKRQARQATTELREAPPGAVKVLVCHHPLVIPPGAPIKTRTRGGPEAARILAEGGVDLVLTGHLHRPFVLRMPQGDGCTWSIGAGTLSCRQRGDPASFTIVSREADAVRTTVWRIENGHAAPAESLVLTLRGGCGPVSGPVAPVRADALH
jgi:3',5'-cyclic AMP phosphodiesterase CpdA